MTFTRTQVSTVLLDDILKAKSVSVDVLLPGGFVQTTDRSILYSAAIEALVEQAKSEGFDVRDGGMEELSVVAVFPRERCPDCDENEDNCDCFQHVHVAIDGHSY